jgi:serine/threonine protein kinase
MNNKKILEGLFCNKKKVVVKVADATETLHNEWLAYQSLASKKVNGILKYHCFFTCNDNISRFLTDQPSVCNGPGDSAQVLVMEYVDAPSMKHYCWWDRPIEVWRSCVKQVILTSVEAYMACKFIHGDLHLDNVLVKRTARRSIKYPTLNVEVQLHNLCTKFMDFELSTCERKPILDLYKDIRVFTNKLYGLVGDYMTLGPLQSMNLQLRDWVEDSNRPTNPQVIVDALLPMIDQVEFLQRRHGGSRAASMKRKKPQIGRLLQKP